MAHMAATNTKGFQAYMLLHMLPSEKQKHHKQDIEKNKHKLT